MANKQKKQTLPRYISVLGTIWQVRMVPSLVDEEGERMDGMTTMELSNNICIDANLSRRRQWTTLIHEAMHAGYMVSGLDNLTGTKLDEALVRCAEIVVVQLLEQFGENIIREIKNEHNEEDGSGT